MNKKIRNRVLEQNLNPIGMFIFKKTILTALVFLILKSTVAQVEPLPQDKEMSEVAYPYQVKSYHFKSQGQNLKMAYIDEIPDRPNGKTVVLMHGKNFNSAHWHTTIKHLLKEGYRVVAPDQVGFGKSSKPSSYQFTFQQLAYNSRLLVDSLAIPKISLVGHSMGGMLASRFALMYDSLVEKLILVNPIGLEDYRELTPYQTLDASYAAELKNTPESYRNYQLKFYYDNQWKKEYEPWLNMLSGFTLHPDYPVVAWNAALTSDMIYTQPVINDFPLIKRHTLLVIGTRDRTAIGKERAKKDVQDKMGLYQLLGKKAKKLIPNSSLIEIHDCGHLPHIEKFEVFIKALSDFLKKKVESNGGA